MSVYDRINATATANKAQAWKQYTPLTLEQLGKEHHDHSKVKEREPEDVVIVHRETENLAIKHALGWFRFMSEDPVIRLTPIIPTRYCIRCHKKHPLTDFSTDELDKLICVKARVKSDRYYYRRESKKGRRQAVASV